MKKLIYFVFLSVVFKNFIFHIVDSSPNKEKTFLVKDITNEVFLRRYKRYLVFEKGATLTIQGNIAKSIIPPAPRGLNVIMEYTLSYELPSDLYVIQRKPTKPTKIPVTSTARTTSNPAFRDHMVIPFSHDYIFHMSPEYMKSDFYSEKKSLKSRCLKRKFYDYHRKNLNTCLMREKRDDDWSLSKLNVSQRIFYDLIEKWSLLHGFLPRYCFMRTLCESSEFLLPYGHSLLHDIIHILLRYTKPWALRHKLFGRSLRQWYSIDKCVELYGLYCRVSWLDFITNVVGGSWAADTIR